MISEEYQKTRPRCATCIHFVPRRGNDGVCTAHPPQVGRVMKAVPRPHPLGKLLASTTAPVGQQAIDLIDDVQSYFAPSGADRFCGEHPDFAAWYQTVRGVRRSELAGDGPLPAAGEPLFHNGFGAVRMAD